MSNTAILAEGAPSHIRPGLVLGGKYRLEDEIGRGSMGTVYRAVHVTLGQRVAIKLISAEHLQSSEARKRFRVEAKAAAKLRSRHVVQVYDDGETSEGNPYIVLEYLEGETLEQRLEREHDVALADAVRIVTHVGRALARAHAQGIVHRDLKPANIFLVKSEDDEVGWLAKVLDFGIAKLDSQSESGTTQAGTVLGTPLFMSPEQVRGASSVDHRADLYSLGMCLFHMLTGDYAHYSPNNSDILIGICTLPLPLLREKAPWVPDTVEQWFQRACATEPLERFQSADEMSEALHAAAGGSALSKSKSFGEGRVAPETLLGYAAPTAATLLDPGPAGLARTQQAVGAQALPGRAALLLAPSDISLGAAGRHVTGAVWNPPRNSLPPLALGIALGLALVITLALVAAVFGNSQQSSAAAPSARAPARSVPVSSASTAGAREAPQPAATAEREPQPALAAAPVSSVAAEGATIAGEKPRSKATRPKKAAGIVASARAAKVPPQAALGKAASSDLGF